MVAGTGPRHAGIAYSRDATAHRDPRGCGRITRDDNQSACHDRSVAERARRTSRRDGTGAPREETDMRFPQVTDRVKEAPAHALRAMFAGIGQVLLVADRMRSRPAGPDARAE